MFLVHLIAILCATRSRKAGMYRVLSIHSPDYAFTVLVSIFIYIRKNP